MADQATIPADGPRERAIQEVIDVIDPSGVYLNTRRLAERVVAAVYPLLAAQVLHDAARRIDAIDTDRRGEPDGEAYLEGLHRAVDELVLARMTYG